MEDLENGVATRLRAVMAEFNILTNAEMGDFCGASGSVVNNWINRTNLPRIPEMLKLCEKTGLTLDWVYQGQRSATVEPKLYNRLQKRIDNGQIKPKVIRRGSEAF